MKILVMSDSHGDYFNMRKVLMSHSDVELVFFCGDGEEEILKARLEFPEKMFIAVRGNCDWGSQFQVTEFFSVEGKKIMVTHGHKYYVKSGYSELIESARENNCDIVLFGHTHNPYTNYDNGLYILNPGSAHGYGATFGLIDITPKGILTNVASIK